MPTLLLIRHGENDFVKTGRMAGHTPGVNLNDHGKSQAEKLANGLKKAPIIAVYSSPLERAIQTATPIAGALQLEIQVKPNLIESYIGEWQGQELKAVKTLPVWSVVQNHPSRFRFPGGESFVEMQTRVVEALEEIAKSHAAEDLVACVFHADPIKLALAHYLGMPLDHFQRLSCDTASVSVLRLGQEGEAQVAGMNLHPPFHFPKPQPAKKTAEEKPAQTA